MARHLPSAREQDIIGRKRMQMIKKSVLSQKSDQNLFSLGPTPILSMKKTSKNCFEAISDFFEVFEKKFKYVIIIIG